MEFLEKLGIGKTHQGASVGGGRGWLKCRDRELGSFSPINGDRISTVVQASREDYDQVVAQAKTAFLKWRTTPAPMRGQIVREIGLALREYKEPLGRLISLEMGKIVAEGEGEVQEMIDIADFAVGLSRQLYGLTMHSERPQHRMYEQWHPLGPVGIITAFNFPVAVWSWNALIAAVCGDVVIWKPSSKTPLCAVAVMNIIAPVVERYDLSGVFNLVIGPGSGVGDAMIQDRRLPLISATGSCNMGRKVGAAVAERLGRSLLELGGNNAVIVTEDADLDMAVRAVLFGAVGTAGQRCTSTRRVIIHHSVKERFVSSLVRAYEQVKIGNPLDEETLMGPLVDQEAVEKMIVALQEAESGGARILCGGRPLRSGPLAKGSYVEPAIVEAPPDLPIMREEVFAPILYIVSYRDFAEALALHNNVDQGLSSAVFTGSLRSSEEFLSHAGSDCGIANVNIGTSGAEIGGAFGGEKDTGGGRESGSDAWKNYMRRQTNTINWSSQLPLAQGIRFEMDGDGNGEQMD
ncbi:MAG: aldehyde dehydrogenase family protein [Deltaproteobacteria bacterium]|nr:aldehyde dehydrogenase family protein [Deltaproteobacteria bacterium]